MPAVRNEPPPSRTVASARVYHFWRSLVRLINRALFRARWFHTERVPDSGPLLIVANHQSFLDPTLVGCAVTNRHLAYLARAGLFRFWPLGWLLYFFNCVPVSESGGDVAAMKTVISAINSGNAVLIFPEGSRSPDGRLAEFKRGTALILRKAPCPVIPVAVLGTYEAWPRHRKLPVPFLRPVAACYGSPIPHDELMADGPDAALRRLHDEVAALQDELRLRLGHRHPRDAHPSRS